jgi:GAF domain-containing protein
VEERTRDLRESLEQQTATSEILRVISQSQTNAQPVFDTIAVRARVLCGAAHVGVTTYDGQLIHIVALSNVRPEGAAALLGAFPRPPGRETATGRAILDRTVVTISDVTEYPEYGLAHASQTVTFRSAMAVPMLRDGNPIGTMGLPELEWVIFGHF